MEKKPFITLEKAREIAQSVPTPFHLYDEEGIRARARQINEAFAWNPGFREYFAVKATPNPYLLKILQEEGCGVDCSSYTEPRPVSCVRVCRTRHHVLLQRHAGGRVSDGGPAGGHYQLG